MGLEELAEMMTMQGWWQVLEPRGWRGEAKGHGCEGIGAVLLQVETSPSCNCKHMMQKLNSTQ